MKLQVILFTGLCYSILFCFKIHSKKLYHGYKVYELMVAKQQLQEVLYDLHSKILIDVWSAIPASTTNSTIVTVLVKPSDLLQFTNYITQKNIPYKISVDNVQSIVDQTSGLSLRYADAPKFDFETYHRYNVIEDYLDELSEEYPNITNVVSIGKTSENRHIKLMKISAKNDERNKPIILIEAGIHAREWVAPAMAMYIIRQLVENVNYRYLIEDAEWHIIPVLNPDGYEFTHVSDRFWRKTRSKRESKCFGVDANRNFDYYWNSIGASNNPCSEVYAGPTAFSEPETKAFRNHALSHKSRIKMYLSFHSYGNYILYPWSYTADTVPRNAENLKNLAESANKLQLLEGGKSYTIGSAAKILYPAAGGTDDWMMGKVGVNFSYTIELPGGGTQGFDLPPKDIYDTVSQFFKAVQVFGDYVIYGSKPKSDY